jgi:hypothetical protein
MLIIEHAKSEMKNGLRPKSKSEKRQKKWKDHYFEFHHILPKSLYPLWAYKNTNVVCLTAREHFFCHQLLTKIYKSNKMLYALYRLAYDGNHMVSSREYDSLRASYSNASRERAKKAWKAGKMSITAYKLNDEQKKQMKERKQAAWASWSQERKDEYHKRHSESTKGLDNSKNFRENNRAAFLLARQKQAETMRNKTAVEKLEIANKRFLTIKSNPEKYEHFKENQRKRVLGKKWVTNGKETKYIDGDEVNIFLSSNPDWHLGRTLKEV